MISHRNVIANSIQIATFETPYRESLSTIQSKLDNEPYCAIALDLLPQSHIYALVYICHAGPYRGDQVIVLPRFELKAFLETVQKFRITELFLV